MASSPRGDSPSRTIPWPMREASVMRDLWWQHAPGARPLLRNTGIFQSWRACSPWRVTLTTLEEWYRGWKPLLLCQNWKGLMCSRHTIGIMHRCACIIDKSHTFPRKVVLCCGESTLFIGFNLSCKPFVWASTTSRCCAASSFDWATIHQLTIYLKTQMPRSRREARGTSIHLVNVRGNRPRPKASTRYCFSNLRNFLCSGIILMWNMCLVKLARSVPWNSKPAGNTQTNRREGSLSSKHTQWPVDFLNNPR